MPAPCPSCGHDLILGSLRCQYCGADARGAQGAAPRLSFADAIGHDVEAFVTRLMGAAFVRRNKIVDRLHELSPEFLAWARQDIATRGPCPPLSREQETEIDALMDEYTRLL